MASEFCPCADVTPAYGTFGLMLHLNFCACGKAWACTSPHCFVAILQSGSTTGIKTDESTITANTEFDMEYLAASKDFSSILADLRIAMATENYVPQMWKHRGSCKVCLWYALLKRLLRMLREGCRSLCTLCLRWLGNGKGFAHEWGHRGMSSALYASAVQDGLFLCNDWGFRLQ